MNWRFIFSVSLLIIFAVILQAEAGGFLRKGYIINGAGEKCWYKQKTEENNTYFHGDMKNTVGIIAFDNPQCMSDSGAGLDINKMMINNVITRWYSHSDSNFKTRASELYPSSLFQKKGQCIQSKKYPSVGVTVDYFIKNNGITGVIHGLSVQGCKK